MNRRKKAPPFRNLTLKFDAATLARIREVARLEQRSIAAVLRARLAPEYPLDMGPVRELIIAVGHRAIAGKLTPPELDGLAMLAELCATVRASAQSSARRSA